MSLNSSGRGPNAGTGTDGVRSHPALSSSPGRVVATSRPELLHPLASLPVEELIVVEIINGIADTSLVHRPARNSGPGRGGSRFDQFDFAPSRWPSACRRLASGSVYARAGEFADAPVCPECLAVAA